MRMRFQQMGAMLAALALAGCGSDNSGSDSGGDDVELGDVPPVAATAVSPLADFVGAPARAVWVQQQKAGQLDKHAAGKSLKLMGIDSRDGGGEREIMAQVGSYALPLLTPDGQRVVFTDKGRKKAKSGKRSYRAHCYVVDFDGGGLRELGAGLAESLWRDPADGVIWVYVTVGFKASKTTIMEGERLERFRLDSPKERQVVWQRSQVGGGSFRLSRSGKKMVGLFPWPDAGVVDRQSGELTRLGNGCWTSIAPDDSGVVWVFDGAHKHLRLHDPTGAKISEITINSHPDLQGKRVYHPRWTNHPRYVVLTGPYRSDQKKGADKVEAYVARLAADLGSVEAWHPLTDNKRADLYPDLWVEGGESVDLVAVPVAAPEPAAASEPWPLDHQSLLFAWRSSRDSIEVGGTICRVTAKGAARYGRRFDLAPGNGWFEANSINSEELSKQGSLTIDAVVTPAAGDGTIIAFAKSRLRQVGGQWQWIATTPWGGGARFSFGEIVVGKAVHLVLKIAEGEIEASIDGRPVAIKKTVTAEDNDREHMTALCFGGPWDGRLERLAIYAAAVDPGAFDDLAREAINGRVKVVAKLLEKTRDPELKELGAYRRALVYYLYEIESVTGGEIAVGSKIAIGHWVILDRQPAAGLPDKIGASYPLQLDPLAAHPELASERSFNELSDFDAPLFFDIRTPELQQSANDDEK